VRPITALIVSGVVLALTLGTRIHHFAVNPHLTEMEAFRLYWPAHIAVGAVMLVYVSLLRTSR
jgi:hypothetical protein